MPLGAHKGHFIFILDDVLLWFFHIQDCNEKNIYTYKSESKHNRESQNIS